MHLARRSQLTMTATATRAGVPDASRKPVPTQWVRTNSVTRIVLDDFWFETTLDDDWVVAYRIVSQPEGLVVGEVRLFPADAVWRDRRTRRGEWSGDLLGTRAWAPQGGVTTQLLRRVRIDSTIWDGREALEFLTQHHGRIQQVTHPHHGHGFVPFALHRAGIGKRIQPPTRQAGRPRLPVREYKRLATEYTRLWLRGVRGRALYATIAHTLQLSESQVRNRVSRARQYGFLGHLPARPRRRWTT